MTDPIWELTGKVGDQGRHAVRYMRAPTRKEAAAAFGLRPEDLKIRRLRPDEKIGPQPQAPRR